MKGSLHPDKKNYLDVSQFILKQHSPQFKPLDHHHDDDSNQMSKYSLWILLLNDIYASCLPYSSFLIYNQNHYSSDFSKTPQIDPIDHEIDPVQMTPLLTGLQRKDKCIPIEDYFLNGDDNFKLQLNYDSKQRKKNQKVANRNRSNSVFSIGLMDYFQLEKIAQEEEFFSADQSYWNSQNSQQDSYVSQNSSDLESQSLDKYGDRTKSKFSDERIFQLTQFADKINRYLTNPKKEINKQIKELAHSSQFSDQEKMEKLRNFIKNYLVQYQLYCYEQSWRELRGTFEQIIKEISAGIHQTFAKKIGCLSFQQRRIKLLKYLQKKKKRIWKKKVNYDCRKKVADGRLRIKGKFVTRERACQQLGMQSLEGMTAIDIKELLLKKMDERQNNSKSSFYE